MRASRTLGLNTVGLLCQAKEKDFWPNAYCLESLYTASSAVTVRRCGCDDGASRLRRRFQTTARGGSSLAISLCLLSHLSSTRRKSLRVRGQTRRRGLTAPGNPLSIPSPLAGHRVMSSSPIEVRDQTLSRLDNSACILILQ